jgi:hypothetical protein
MSTPPDQLPRRRTSVGEVLLHINELEGRKLDPRMAKILAAEQKKFDERKEKDDLQGLDPRMRRRMEDEQRRFEERQKTQGTAPPDRPPPQVPQQPQRPSTAPPVDPATPQGARKKRVAASLKTVAGLLQSFTSQEKDAFPVGSTKAATKATDRALVGNGPLFKPVLKAMAMVESSPQEPNLAALELAAKAYLADYDRRVNEGKAKGKAFKPDKITATKEKTCRDALEKVRHLRAMRALQAEAKQLPTEGTTSDQEASVSRTKAKMLVEAGGSRQLGQDESGASESFFLSDPGSGEKNFIFKPSDGEFDAGYGWKKGGGAPREVALSAVNDAMRNTLGLDCGVSTTTLVKVDHPSVATERNGGKSERVGAIQNFVQAEGHLGDKLDKDPQFLAKIPAEDIEKVALLDFATLQMDRQASNLLVKRDENGDPRLTPIDAGNALPSRKAFEASRRMFGNNALLAGDEAKKPFSPEMLQKIQAMDENAIVAAMKKANSDMAAIDPQAAKAVDDESIEISRRSMKFLKKAASQLTKAEIANAYAFEFHKVLDAGPKETDVDAAIDAAIKATLAKPAQAAAIKQIAEPEKTFSQRLGWPRDEYNTLLAEDPARLLDILQKGTECPATLKEIKDMIDEIGLAKFKPDPSTVKDVGQRRIDVYATWENTKNEALLAGPDVDRTMKAVGAEFIVTNAKGERKAMALVSDKVKLVNAANDYAKGKGDDVLRRLGKQPEKMAFDEKYYWFLGGDAAFQDIQRQNLNPYDGKFNDKIEEILLYREYVKLGGDEEYVRLGCPQNKEITLDNRVKFIKAKRKLA